MYQGRSLSRKVRVLAVTLIIKINLIIMTFIDVKQNSREWDELRLGRATSSNFAKIMANGNRFGEPAKRYAYEIALEIVTGRKDETNSFQNKYMKRGNDFQPIAEERYEQEMFQKISNGGFFYNSRFGDSPDGNLPNNGALEIKTVIASVQKERILKGGYDTTYRWQIAGHFLIGEKDYVDYVSFCPEMPEKKQFYLYRISRAEFEDEIESLKVKLELFWELVQEEINFLNDNETYNLINL